MTLERKAIEALHANGWGQSALQDSLGRICASGALRLAATGKMTRCQELAESDYTEALRRCAGVIMEQFPEQASPYTIEGDFDAHKCVTTFNDNLATTQADVELVLEKAAVKAEEL